MYSINPSFVYFYHSVSHPLSPSISLSVCLPLFSIFFHFPRTQVFCELFDTPLFVLAFLDFWSFCSTQSLMFLVCPHSMSLYSLLSKRNLLYFWKVFHFHFLPHYFPFFIIDVVLVRFFFATLMFRHVIQIHTKPLNPQIFHMYKVYHG